jgi:hypothetical protein
MKCVACNRLLTDFEATIRNERTGEFMDLCKPCLISVEKEFSLLTRKDLEESVEESEEE